MPQITPGSTDVTRYVMLRDSIAGTPETGVTITGLDLQYTRNRSDPSTKVDATALSATDDAHADNQAIEVDATSSPGLYRVDWPDAAFAAGVDKVILVVSGAGLDPAVEEIELTSAAVGSGAISFTYTVYEPDGITPIPGVDIWVTTDAAGTNVIAGVLVSDANGEVDFMLDAGTVYVWRQLAGWNFTNPDTETVA